MAIKARGFKELGVLPCSHQSPADRYPTNEDERAPAIARYRNNLTALSHSWNLFFVAYLDKIYVYKPQFPTQKLPNKPELVLDLPRTSPGLSGYINPSKPHGVNQLMIADLGYEEIVIVACDDGDVLAYTTRSICEAIENHIMESGVDRLPSTAKVREILFRNVGLSAWGIAVHKDARLIAVSANTHRISVFAFALCREVSPDRSGEPGDRDDSPMPTSDLDLGPDEWTSAAGFSNPFLYRSTFNFQIVLKGHKTNIPNIAFCNTAADPNGRYLVSTDIGGSTFVWDIWKRKILADMTHHHNPGDKCGWGVACLDPLSFRLSNSVEEMYGCPRISYHNGSNYPFQTSGVVVDNSFSYELVPDSSSYHPSYATLKTVPALGEVIAHIIGGTEAAAEMSGSGDDELEESEEESENAPLNPESDVGFVASELSAIAALVTLAQQPNSQQSNGSNTQPTCMEMDEPAGDLSQATKPPKKPKIKTLPFHILHSSESDLHLLTDVRYVGESSTCNTVKCQDALRQKIPPVLRHLNYFDRMQMVLQIPEIGVVAVANQVGRVALLTMTRLAKDPGITKFGFRLEWFLPFKSQEEQGKRPDAPLLGMAIGPVQGFETASSSSAGRRSPGDSIKWPVNGANGTRRFRLMLTYYDHTVLTYEIWRPSIDSQPGLRDLGLLIT